MKKHSSPAFCYSARLICVLVIILIQFPAISLGFELKNSQLTNTFSKIFDSVFAAKNTASPLVAFSNPASITITDRNNNTAGGTNGISNPYPSTINVSGLSGTISDVNVTLTGFSAARPRDIDVVVVAPGGQTLMIMSDTGGLNSTSPGVNLTFDDSAAASLSDTAQIVLGTYKPTDYVFSTTDSDTFPAPGPSSINRPAPTGSSTLASVFNGLTPNGNWNLYIIDDSLGGGNSAVTGGWSIDITTAGAVAATSTSIVSNTNPALTTQTITFTSTTTQNSNNAAVTTGTVSFTNNGTAIAGCTNVAVNASGNATCSTTLPQGTRTITATYNGNASFGMSSGNLTQIVNSPTVVNGSQFCNNGGVTVPDSGAASPYPANINVSELVGTISKVTVQLNGLTAPRPANLDLLLVNPNNQAFQIVSDVGDLNNPATNINLTLDDNAATQLPQNIAITSGTFRPTDYDILNAPDTYPAPAPAAFNQPAPSGASTFASVYGGSNPNGNWSFYAVDDGVGGGASTISGVCLNFTVSKFSTSTSVASSKNPSPQGQSVTFTATVTTTGTGTPSGTVEFFNGATSLGTRTLNASGQATLTTPALPLGTNNITAQYQGANVGAGGGGYLASTSTVLQQVVVLAPTAAPVNISGRILSSSGRGVSKAVVKLTDIDGNVRYSVTNPFGYYRFTQVPTGNGYIVNIETKRMQFPTLFIDVTQELNNLNITASQ